MNKGSLTLMAIILSIYTCSLCLFPFHDFVKIIELSCHIKMLETVEIYIN